MLKRGREYAEKNGLPFVAGIRHGDLAPDIAESMRWINALAEGETTCAI
jgi:hypothetical protein